MGKPPTIAIPLDLPDVQVLRTEFTPQRELIIGVESTVPHTTCHQCGRTIDRFYGYDRPIRLRHLPILGTVVYIAIRPKRFACPYCDDHPTTTQQVDWYTPKSPFTKAYERQVLRLLINSTIADVCQKEGVAPDAVSGVMTRWVADTVDWAVVPTFTTLGIDEIALKKGHRDDVVIVTARDPARAVHVLAVLPDRTKATLSAWLTTMPPAIQRQIRTVCTDMWTAYVQAVAEVLPHAAIVIDRFHVACHAADAADNLRKAEVARLRKTLPKAEAETLKGTMWLFRKRTADLDVEERKHLDRLLAHSPAVAQAHAFREAFTVIFDTTRSKAAGMRKLRIWMRKVRASGLTCFDDFLGLLATWLDRIANYFRSRQTSAFVEGLNNKLKVLKRRCFGIFNLRHFFQRITLDLEGYGRLGLAAPPPHYM